jgi:hypothetical protein
MVVYQDRLIIAGSFREDASRQALANVASWDGSRMSALDDGSLSGVVGDHYMEREAGVYALQVFQGKL